MWQSLPKELKFLAVLAIFLYAGETILQAIIFAWNVLGVNALNLMNGCATGNTAACIPQMPGLYLFGINIADYWTITMIIIFTPIIMFAFKWYAYWMQNR